MMVLIDGHNLIGKMSDIKLDDADDEEKLILKLRQYRARTGRKVIVIFDPGYGFQLASKQTKGGFIVQYASQGQSADQLIINRLYKASQPQQVLVVTSDRAIQHVAKQVKAKVIPSSDFASELTFLATNHTNNDDDGGGDDDDDDINLSEDEINEWLTLFNRKCD